MTVKVVTFADIPDELVHAWLQHLRDFDTAHPGCHFQIAADAPDMSDADIIEAIKVGPPLPFHFIMKR